MLVAMLVVGGCIYSGGVKGGVKGGERARGRQRGRNTPEAFGQSKALGGTQDGRTGMPLALFEPRLGHRFGGDGRARNALHQGRFEGREALLGRRRALPAEERLLGCLPVEARAAQVAEPRRECRRAQHDGWVERHCWELPRKPATPHAHRGTHHRLELPLQQRVRVHLEPHVWPAAHGGAPHNRPSL